MLNWTLFIGCAVISLMIFKHRENARFKAFQEHGHWALSFLGWLFAVAAGYYGSHTAFKGFIGGIVLYNSWTRLFAAVGLAVIVIDTLLAALPDVIFKHPMGERQAVGTIVAPSMAVVLTGWLAAFVVTFFSGAGHSIAQILGRVLPR